MTKLTKNSETECLAFASPDLWAELDTPCTLIAAEVVERNITRMADYCRQRGISLRPHTKTHKSKHIGRMQLDAGAAGLTVAKPGEADVMFEIGGEVLVAYPSVTAASLKAIERGLAGSNVLVALDSLEAIERLDNALSGNAKRAGVLVDIDIGVHRTGAQTPDESVRLATKIVSSSKLRLDGLFCYPGHIWSLRQEQNVQLAEVERTIQIHLGRWRAEGLEAKIVSGGSTPTAYQSHLSPSVNEIRPGTYVFNDLNTLRGGFCTLADCAVRIVATVVSTAFPGQVIIDAGAKTLAVDQCISAPDTGHGFIVEYPNARIRQLS